MAKCMKTIYFESAPFIKAEEIGIDIGAICNEALKIAVNNENAQGTTEGALGNFLNHQAGRAKDLAICRRLYAHKEKDRNDNFNKAIRMFCEKYELDLAAAMKEVSK